MLDWTCPLLAAPRPVPPGHGGSLSFAGPNESNQSKGPNTIWPKRSGKKVRPATCGSARGTARPTRRANALALRPGRLAVVGNSVLRQPRPVAEASGSNRIQALCFGDFHLGQQMKGTGQPGPDPARSRQDKA